MDSVELREFWWSGGWTRGGWNGGFLWFVCVATPVLLLFLVEHFDGFL